MKTAVINNGISEDFETCCRVMHDSGIASVEIQRVDNVPVEMCTPAQAAGWRRTCGQYGITPVCVTTHAFGGVPVASASVGDAVHARHLDLLRNGFDIAGELGAAFVRSQTFTKTIVTWGSHGAEEWMANNNTAWCKSLRLFEPAVRLAEDAGVTLLVETCFNSMNSTAALNRKLVADMGSKRLKLLWDPCNALLFHEYPTLEVYESVKDIIGHIHIKDAVVDTVTACVDFRPLGRGMIAPYLDGLAEALRRDGYDGCVSLESVYKPDGGDVRVHFRRLTGVPFDESSRIRRAVFATMERRARAACQAGRGIVPSSLRFHMRIGPERVPGKKLHARGAARHGTRVLGRGGAHRQKRRDAAGNPGCGQSRPALRRLLQLPGRKGQPLRFPHHRRHHHAGRPQERRDGRIRGCAGARAGTAPGFGLLRRRGADRTVGRLAPRT